MTARKDVPSTRCRLQTQNTCPISLQITPTPPRRRPCAVSAVGLGLGFMFGFRFGLDSDSGRDLRQSAATCGNLRRVAAICGEPRHARHPKRTAAHLIFSFLPDAPSDTLILPRICVPGFSTFPSKSTNRVPLGAWGFPGAARAKRGIYVPRFSPPPSERRIHAGAPKNPGIIGILDKSPRHFSVAMTTKKFFTNAQTTYIIQLEAATT